MRKNNERGEISGAFLMIVGLILIILLLGVFSLSTKKTSSTTNSSNTSTSTNNSTHSTATNGTGPAAVCGIVLDAPQIGQVVRFPLYLSGMITGCNWKPVNGVAATAYIAANDGTHLTDTIDLTAIQSGTTGTYSFVGNIYEYTQLPQTSTGKLVVTSASSPSHTFSRKVNISGNRISYGECGITVDNPRPNAIIRSPLHVSGRVVGCGWEVQNGTFGSVALFSNDGTQVTGFVPLGQSSDWNGNNGITADIIFPSSGGNVQGYLLFMKAGEIVGNASAEYRVPVVF